MIDRGALALLLALSSGGASADVPPSTNPAVPEVSALEPELEALYKDLHQHPELAFHEQRTAGVLASRVKALGFEVTTGIAQTGIVAIMRNGPGPVVMLRTELDALPVEEHTGLPFASKVTTHASGATVPYRARLRP
jgi:hippurate hydrolase